MGKAYFSKADARMRIHRTICLYDGYPVYVDVGSSAEGDEVCIYPLDKVRGGSTKPQRVKYTDDKFIYKSPPLGYAFYKNKAFYVCRIPDRMQRQGLSFDSLAFVGDHPNNYADGGEKFFYSKAMVDCILGKHVSLDKGIEMLLEEGASAVPIGRRLAVSLIARNTIGLEYRTKCIGMKDRKRNSFELYSIPEKPFLLKILSKEGIPCY